MQVFREIEEASERRAEEEDEAESIPGPLDRNPFPALDFMSPRNRRRKSISVSRVGSVSLMQSQLLMSLLAHCFFIFFAAIVS